LKDKLPFGGKVSFSQFCDVPHTGNHPQEKLVKFGYMVKPPKSLLLFQVFDIFKFLFLVKFRQ
jgi:hypothetical protein